MPEDTKIGGNHFSVGGVLLDRPFRIRRLGHFGLDVRDIEAGVKFYTEMFGLKIADPIDFGSRLPPEEQGKHGPSVGYFMRHGTDHHSFVLFPIRVRRMMLRHLGENMTINQITWQVGSLREVVEGSGWLKETGIKIARAGRDNPGSNWHAYPLDPEGHTNEIYYGIEQIGWDGLSKPKGMHRRDYHQSPTLPHRSEFAEVEEGFEAGVDILKANRFKEPLEETYDVGGILLARPFKVTKIGPIRIFVKDVEDVTTFYRDAMGLKVTEEVVWNGHRCVFLRANNEHHSLAIYPAALREELGLSPHTSLFSCGFQVADYTQLRNAVSFLQEKGVTVRKLPPELFPGIDYSAFAIDPDGHAIQLYYYMEQIGWDGRPMPASQRRKIDNENWPEYVPAQTDTYNGEVYLGPWN
ncbi:VOC family protein [Roseiarcaceae bacterium H3SJ34-1]|uniref:VOC family protein n=1 Tax=Terripilifer ovatus TaxID=3032367 RepID=UPI003AB96E34|nr:VOC family protein [Roseiarcaceae bacterium H3SJ34-1]